MPKKKTEMTKQEEDETAESNVAEQISLLRATIESCKNGHGNIETRERKARRWLEKRTPLFSKLADFNAVLEGIISELSEIHWFQNLATEPLKTLHDPQHRKLADLYHALTELCSELDDILPTEVFDLELLTTSDHPFDRRLADLDDALTQLRSESGDIILPENLGDGFLIKPDHPLNTKLTNLGQVLLKI